MGRKIVPKWLDAVKQDLRLHYDHFFHKCPDDVWIPEATKRGWIIISPDKLIEGDSINRAAVIRASAKVFLLSSKDLVGEEMAAILVVCRGRINELASAKSGPFIVRITKHVDMKPARFFGPEEQKETLNACPERLADQRDLNWILGCPHGHSECA